jgi:hypothetical protein
MTFLTMRMASAHPVVRAAVLAHLAEGDELTKAAVERRLRRFPASDRKGLSLAAGVVEILNLATRIRRVTTERVARRTIAPSKSLRERQLERSKKGLIAAAKRVVKWGAPGGCKWIVTPAGRDDPATYNLTTEPNYGVYKGRFKGWAANSDTHRFRVPDAWWLRVRPIGDGSGVIQGWLILDARLFVGSPGDRAIYEATVAGPGRGYSAVVDQGFVSAWPYGVATPHWSLDAALSEPVPERVRRRFAAERVHLDPEDLAALDRL